ncbi:FAD-binding protein [Paraburkholderia caledonica]|jgi:L-aspartate oxidase|uniref:FAD-binding protein n=2 Tax=Paraburkholderia caledonica TaxID=134536 RepID=UPI0038B8A2CA
MKTGEAGMSDRYREVSTDVLVVGSGGAALRAALEAESSGADVLVVIKGEFRKSGATFHSVAEVGAFNVPDGAGDPSDNPDVFLADILHAAQGMADPRLSAILANEAHDSLRYLEQYGVKFEREDDHYLVFRACFSSRPRSHVIHEHFKPIVKSLGTEASRRGIKVMDRLMIVDLLSEDGECLGAYAIDSDGNPLLIRAKSTILTTGGASQLFAQNLYPSDITGDGYAMAYRAGARLVNMEFMQAGVSVLTPFVNLFGNYLWDAQPNLTDRDGRAFVPDYLPAGLAQADVIRQKERHFPFSSSDISRYVEISIQKALNDGRGTAEGGVFLDFAGCNFESILADKSRSIARMWPLTCQWYKEHGVDLYRDRVQITCSAHAINGGLYIDENAQSNLKGLFAAGEVAAGPHGADRLGGNMAVTCQVFGRRAGLAAAERAKKMTHRAMTGVLDDNRTVASQFRRNGRHTLDELKARIQQCANRYLLIVREEAGLHTFRRVCRETRSQLFQDTLIGTPAELMRGIELANLIQVGELMASASLVRRESRGGHYREDFPERNADFACNIFLERNVPEGVWLGRLADLSS